MRKIEFVAPATSVQVDSQLPRALVSIDSVKEAVSKIISEVRADSLTALRRHAHTIDGLEQVYFRVPAEKLAEALEALEPELRQAIELSIERVRKVSEATLPQNVSVEVTPGGFVDQIYVPVDSVGLYAPGGKAVYPSSVVMNVVPAQVAKVPRIAVTSPAQTNGFPHTTVMATCALLGVEEVYAIGGAGAVAAFAFGIPELGLNPVEMVTGPGNVYVAAAKRALRDVIGIDSEAGPTEILILADETANASFIAADLISQAEHDVNAAAVLVTDSKDLIDAVEAELQSQIMTSVNKDRIEASLDSIQSALVLVKDLDAGIAVANAYATEHLEIQTRDPQLVAKRVTNAGAIFIGPYSPVSLGDYLAGSNHVLPTGTQARFSSGLSVMTFLRAQQQINYSKIALSETTSALEVFSKAEGLDAHGRAATIRQEEY